MRSPRLLAPCPENPSLRMQPPPILLQRLFLSCCRSSSLPACLPVVPSFSRHRLSRPARYENQPHDCFCCEVLFNLGLCNTLHDVSSVIVWDREAFGACYCEPPWGWSFAALISRIVFVLLELFLSNSYVRKPVLFAVSL
jgi:hypothetical protein